MSNRKRVPRYEILDKMHISKTTYYELRESLVRSAINSIYPDILERELLIILQIQIEGHFKDKVRTKYNFIYVIILI